VKGLSLESDDDDEDGQVAKDRVAKDRALLSSSQARSTRR
jgi:hypothetical protein